MSSSADRVDIRSLWRGKYWLLLSLAASIGLGVVYIYKVDPAHQASARLLVEQQGLPLNQETAHHIDKAFLPTQAEVAGSAVVITRALETLGKPVGPEQPAEDFDPVRWVREKLSVDPVVGTRVLNLRFESTDPAQAQQIVSAVIASYREYLQSNEQDTNRETLRLLTEKEEELRLEIKSLHQRYQALRADNPLAGEGADRGQVESTLLTELGQNLALAQSRRLQLQNDLAMLSGRPYVEIAGNHPTEDNRTQPNGPQFIPVVQSQKPAAKTQTASPASTAHGAGDRNWKPNLAESLAVLARLFNEGRITSEDPTQVQQSLLEAQIEEKRLRVKLGHKHPDLQAAQQQTLLLEKRLTALAEQTGLILGREIDAALRHEQQLTSMYQVKYEGVKSVEGQLLKEQQLQEEIQRVQLIHDSILGQLKQWELVDQAVAAGQPRVTVRVLEHPQRTEPLGAPPALLLSVCGVVGLVGGVVWIGLLGRIRQRGP